VNNAVSLLRFRPIELPPHWVIELVGIVVDSSGILRLKIIVENCQYAVVIRDGAAIMMLIARNYRARYTYGRAKICLSIIF